jgi:hypothetical protein
LRHLDNHLLGSAAGHSLVLLTLMFMKEVQVNWPLDMPTSGIDKPMFAQDMTIA